MNIDLPSGWNLPLLIAAGVAMAVYVLTGKKAEPAGGGILDKLAGMIGGKGNVLPILVAIYQNRDELRGTVAAFLENLRKVVRPPEAPKS